MKSEPIPSTQSVRQNSKLEATTMDPGLIKRAVPRYRVIELIQKAMEVGENRFARNLSLAWLAKYPGDLPVSLYYARSLFAQSQLQGPHPTENKVNSAIQLAIPILDNLTRSDPEFLAAYQELMHALKVQGIDQNKERLTEINGIIFALGGFPDPELPLPGWSQVLARARSTASKRGEEDPAEYLVHELLLSNLSLPLVGITHVRAIQASGLPEAAIYSLAEVYHSRWPDCLQFSLIMANSLMECGDPVQATHLLHQAVSRDVNGQVATRLWGHKHPYRRLWPEYLDAPVLDDLAIPAGMSTALGWNRLPAQVSGPGNEQPLPKIASPQPAETYIQSPPPPLPVLPEYLRGMQAEMERIAERIKQPYLARSDGRYPVYVVMTTRKGLHAQYGTESTALVDEAMKRLVEAVDNRPRWGAVLFYADEGQVLPTTKSLADMKSKPAKANDAWSIKLALHDLDVSLSKQGEMIGALLIVGGEEVVPFHRLPNPVDDADADVPSDNPYATRDENYFVPEWPVGRIPGGAGNNPSLLLQALRSYALHHSQVEHPKPWYMRGWIFLKEHIFQRKEKTLASLGYSAAIWQNASQSVYKPIHERQRLLVSPPVQVCREACDQEKPSPAISLGERNPSDNGKIICLGPQLRPARMGYFNLHGLADAVEWFGHRNPGEVEGGVDYPVALRPMDIEAHLNHGRAPRVIFTEACYGSHIFGKSVEDSIALKFLASGSQAVVGATCVAYGGVTTPLTAADLLGQSFWNSISRGTPAGEALRQAKIHLAREMHRRQGYLDGEDQKTLIAFVLYGDPLADPYSAKRSPKSLLRPTRWQSTVKVICDRTDDFEAPQAASREVMAHVKKIVTQYLPGMADAQYAVSQEHAQCEGAKHKCPSAQFGAASKPNRPPVRRVVTLSKQVQRGSTVHNHYARLTLDPTGKLVKLVVSR